MAGEHHVSMVQTPPKTIGGILRRLGPGLIIAGSIVGSGELIATTKTGAEAGFALLWLIIIGCVIKVFAQVEFGRYSISTGNTTMDGMNELPGPRLRVNWIVWYWFVMQVFSLAQLGGIVGAVGVSMALTVPMTGDFQELLDKQAKWDKAAAPRQEALIEEHRESLSGGDWELRQATLKRIHQELAEWVGRPRPSQKKERTSDDLLWAAVITVLTAAILVRGRYGMVQNVATALVASFTLITIGNLFALQTHAQWAIGWSDITRGLSFSLPPTGELASRSPLATALAAFGIIGVGASELVAYPYWCLEKGYARFTGRREESQAWVDRAHGWLRVLRWDAWCSMVVYTFATVAFFLLGAAVLHRQGLNPAASQLIPTLAEMYGPVFGKWAPVLFLFGAVAVLYSTFFVATAGNSRVVADAVRVFGLRENTTASRLRWTKFFCGFFPFFSLSMYVLFPDPAMLVLASGVIQAIMLPMLGAAALYFRYRRCDRRILPSATWDACLWISAFGLLLAGGWAALTKLFPALQLLG